MKTGRNREKGETYEAPRVPISRFFLYSFFPVFLLSLFPLLGEPPPTTTAPAPSPSSDPIKEALPILKANYVDFKSLNYKEGDHLSDLIARSNGKISLVAPSAPEPILTTTLPGNILYWRLASFNPQKDWLDLATQLQQAGGAATGIVLDVRANTLPDGVNDASQVLRLVQPHHPFLSSLSGAKTDKIPAPATPFHAPIIVLTDRQTAGAAEILAQDLKDSGALLIGQETSGKGCVFQQAVLTSGLILCYDAGDTPQADGTPLWGHPVVPDIAVKIDDRAEKAALTLIRDKHVLDVIQEHPPRLRMSEAALVQGQDPEYDDYLAALEKKPTDRYMSLPPVRDTVLIRALDSLKAIHLSQRPPLPPSPAAGTAEASTTTQ